MEDRRTGRKKDRRKFPRINKNFILSYLDPSTSDKKYEITQLVNISTGGMCFVTTTQLESLIKIQIKLKIPYLSNNTHLCGKVLDSREKVKGIIYITRLEFEDLPPNAKLLVKEIIDIAHREE
ncbi:hypothetical protein MNBD_UNCLBAC01-304 [hydrothermal vent metagenome]|uniref:PilZ domain-containing protein n=1 Tax=hydrothermal vent metagenome TaxID=652676 RepID=A0A3B1D0Y0_9ZZZZ